MHKETDHSWCTLPAPDATHEDGADRPLYLNASGFLNSHRLLCADSRNGLTTSPSTAVSAHFVQMLSFDHAGQAAANNTDNERLMATE